MRKRTGIALAIAGLVAGLAIGSYGIAMAVTASNASTSTAGALGRGHGGPGGFGHGKGGGMRGGGADLAAVVAKLTGISQSDVQTKRAAGTSYEAIAKTKGVSATAIVETALGDSKTVMDAQVKIGQMTSAQETQFLADAKTRLTTEVSATTAFPAGGPGGGHGMRHGGGLASAVASLTATSVSDVMTQRAAGKSFAQIASAKGVTSDAVIQKALTDATAQLKTRFESEINTTSTVGPDGADGGPGGPGAGGPGGF